MISFHPTEDTLEAYTMGRVDKEEVSKVEEHLLLCRNCQDAVEEIELFVVSTRAAACALQQEHRTVGRRRYTSRLVADRHNVFERGSFQLIVEALP
jgi:cob(I)alamin adenosyltransferase